jgi:hypothetical protein
MSSSLTEDYLRWLAPQIRDEQDGLSHPEREFTGLISLMFDMEFYELVPMDRNRIEDGISLRIEFCNERDISTNSLDYLGPGRFLEVLIALSRRLAFNAGGSNAPGWAWILLSNLNLHRMTDWTSRRTCDLHTTEEEGRRPARRGAFGHHRPRVRSARSVVHPVPYLRAGAGGTPRDDRRRTGPHLVRKRRRLVERRVMDFYQIRTHEPKEGPLELYPDFIVGRSDDLMVQGRTFYAIWDAEKNLWSQDEYEVQRLVDEDLRQEANRLHAETGMKYVTRSMRSFGSNSWTQFRKFVAHISDNHHPLDSKLVFS